MASEKTLFAAINLFNDPEFREQRIEVYPDTRPELDARAATFQVMDQEGRFDEIMGSTMTDVERGDFEEIAAAVLKVSQRKGEK